MPDFFCLYRVQSETTYWDGQAHRQICSFVQDNNGLYMSLFYKFNFWLMHLCLASKNANADGATNAMKLVRNCQQLSVTSWSLTHFTMPPSWVYRYINNVSGYCEVIMWQSFNRILWAYVFCELYLHCLNRYSWVNNNKIK